MSLRGAYLAMHRLADADFADFGITADQFVVLVVLSDGSVMTQSEVCRRTYTDPNTMGSMLALMQRRCLVSRMRHATDGRIRTVMLTPKGKRVFAQAFSGTEAAHRRQLASLFTEEELDGFLGFLRRIIVELTPPPRSRKRQKNKASAAAT
jgi:DNA-binding MarR family transcriptional regulator